MVQPSSGEVRLDGRDISRLGTHKRARLGIGRTFQRLEVFSSLTVCDNVQVGLEIRRSWARREAALPQFLADGGNLRPEAEVDLILERLGLGGLADEPVGSLPTGQARLVELGRALGRPSLGAAARRARIGPGRRRDRSPSATCSSTLAANGSRHPAGRARRRAW